MSRMHQAVAQVLALTVLLSSAPSGRACGPETIEPIFVFKDSPDPPFEEYVRGKLGILIPTMGRKTLFIGYRYVNGGSFTGEEQRGLIDALRGKAPEDEGDDAIRDWIEARKEVAPKDEALPAVYAERQYGGYDFFPNCTRSGFETAIETLKNRTATYGAEDPHVRSWLAVQDKVFQNCGGGTSIPEELGPDSPVWLRKDRDYQIAAAYFYSLNLDEARNRFERIAADNESPWRQTADYLVSRTLVRKASLTNDADARHAIYEDAERHLKLLLGSGGKFANASEKLLALINYRIRPEERVGELGRILVYSNGNENLRQDLIDYVWLLDKFEAQVVKAEQKRKEAMKGDKDKQDYRPDPARMATSDAVNKGELIQIYFFPATPDGKADYEKAVNVYVKPDTSEAEIIELVAKGIKRELTAEEISVVSNQRQEALEHRLWLLSPNRRLAKIVESVNESPNYYGNRIDEPALDLFPAFLRTDELSDWILTFQSADPKAYGYAISKWRETNSMVWLLTAISKADKSSPHLEILLRQAEKVPHDSAAYPTIAYHLVRLKIAFERHAEARKFLEDVLSSQRDLLPVSTQNQFRELGLQLAASRTEFLSYGQRQPAAFYKFGRVGKISELLTIEKTLWSPEYSGVTKDVFEKGVEESYKDLLKFDEGFTFDEKITDAFNWHFPLADLADVGRDPALPDYLQIRVLLSVWTRAVLLKNGKLAQSTAKEITRLAPLFEPIFAPYLEARTFEEREHSALYLLLTSPSLSPYVNGGVSAFVTAEQSNYYFQTSWWCKPPETDYDENFNEIPKVVAKPRFLSPKQLETARREHTALVAIGNAKGYLGERAIAWAKKYPKDIRVPEALFIAVEANKTHKYGCDGWESNESVMREAEAILRKRYPDSSWTARLSTSEN